MISIVGSIIDQASDLGTMQLAARLSNEHMSIQLDL